MLKKYKLLLIILISLLIGLVAVTFSFGNVFFTTKYYKNAIDAYNATASYDVAIGNTAAMFEIEVILLDDTTCLFFGSIDDSIFVVNEMKIKDKKYASMGTSYFYDLRENDDTDNINITEGSYGNIGWSIIFSKQNIDSIANVQEIETIYIDSQTSVYLLLFS